MKKISFPSLNQLKPHALSANEMRVIRGYGSNDASPDPYHDEQCDKANGQVPDCY